MTRQGPIYYAAAAGDIRGTYLCWREGRDDERQMAATYSGQFFDLCKRLGRRGAASAPSDDSNSINDPNFAISARPPSSRLKGLAFHFAQMRIAWWLWKDVRRTGASDVIVMDGVTSYYLLAPLAISGRRVFLTIHTVLKRKGETPTRSSPVIDYLNRQFLQRYCAGCLVASPAIADQVRAISHRAIPIRLFTPLYRRADFERFTGPSTDREPFRLLYAGRIEAEKGVFDLLIVARNLITHGYKIRVDFCGDGDEIERLRREVESSKLKGMVYVHGHLNRSELSNYLEQANAVVVPTKSSFPEGLNQVVIEAVLARRPVVTSDVCPALQFVGAGALEAKCDDLDSYEQCIRSLIEDPDLVAKLVTAGTSLREQFFDPSLAWTEQAYQMMNDACP